MTDPLLLDRVRRRLVADVPGLVDADLRDSSLLLDATARATAERDITDELQGAGPLQALLVLAGVTDVLVNGPADVWLERHGRLERAAVRFADEAAVRRLAVRLAVGTGRRLDDAAPWVDAALPDGTRLHAVIPPLVPHTTISLRVLRAGPPPAIAAPAVVVDLLHRALARGIGTLVVGATGAGKTTLLAGLLGAVPAGERIVLVEDTAELHVRHPHVVRLVTRAPNVEGAGGVDLATLVRQALRMRPDRLVVGEFRGAETGVLLGALTAGHRGAATLHAPDVAGVPARLLALGAVAGLDSATVTALVAVAFELIVVVARLPAGRAVVEVGRLRAGLITEPAWSRSAGFGPSWPVLAARVAA